jgi:hypothetical protein
MCSSLEKSRNNVTYRSGSTLFEYFILECIKLFLIYILLSGLRIKVFLPENAYSNFISKSILQLYSIVL